MKDKPRRSYWTWGFQADEPSRQERVRHARNLSTQMGVDLKPPIIPRAEHLNLRKSRISPPRSLESFCFTTNYERALHSYGADRELAARGHFPNPPDIVAHPCNETDLERLLHWCDEKGHIMIPYGGGSSVVGGVTPPDDCDGIVTVDMDQFDAVVEVDEVSRAARIQAGVYGPHLENQLRPYGYTLRHFPQSFASSTLGGWIATRSGGHYATNHTHIDDFVESVKMLTPSGWWESRRLPGSGAGPSPDRLVIGSEGILGIITEAWMRIQARPRFRAAAGIVFSSWEEGCEAARHIAQAKLWPANLRLLDPELASFSIGMNGRDAVLIIGFESSDIPQGEHMNRAVKIARDSGGRINNEDIAITDAVKGKQGKRGIVNAWRNAFINVGGGLTAGLGLVTGTFETAVTWDRWAEFDAIVRDETIKAIREICGGGTLNCRFTHVYSDGPAPYYTYTGSYRESSYFEQQAAIKKAASDAIIKAGGTITHHHAVGRLHREWYDVQRPGLFGDVLRAAKKTVDPKGLLNPGVIIDP